MIPAQWLLIVYSHEIAITRFERYGEALAAFRAIEAGGDFHAALAREMMSTKTEAIADKPGA